MRYRVILNKQAGDPRPEPGTTPDEIRAAFAAAGVTAHIEEVGPADLGPRIHAAAVTKPDAVVVGGGDGTIRTAAALLADTGIPLGVLPLGTFNHFAKDLGLPTDARAAVALLASGGSHAVDLGEVNGEVFINNCSFGAYAEAVRRRDQLRRNGTRHKSWAMLRASYHTLRDLQRLPFELTVAHGRNGAHPEPARRIRTPLLVVANNRYSGQLLDRSLRERLDAGELWVYALHEHRHLAVLRLLLRAMFRRLDEAEQLEAQPAIALEAMCRSAHVPVALDGELARLHSPFRFRIRRGALRVLGATDKREDESARYRHPPTGLEPSLVR